MKPRCIIISFVVLISFTGKLAYSHESEQIDLERQAQFDIFFSNLEKHSDPTKYQDDKRREAADLISFYTLTVAIFKLIDEIASSTIPVAITSINLTFSSSILIEKIQKNPMNYNEGDMLKFRLNYIEPYKKVVFDSPWDYQGNYLHSLLPVIQEQVSSYIKQYVSQMKIEFHLDTSSGEAESEVRNKTIELSFSKIEFLVIKAINRDFSNIWAISTVAVYKELDDLKSVPKISNIKYNGNNSYLRNTLKIMHKLEQDES